MRIGITGGIGAGKSYVSRLLADSLGIPVYDCDREAKRLMQTEPGIREQLVNLVGDAAYLPDGPLNKTVLAEYLFASEKHARCVNAIVHPAVKRDFLQWASLQEQAGVQTVALESALLADAHLGDALDGIIFVDAPLELRIQRAMQRDAATREQIEARIARQRSVDDYCRSCDFVVVNDGRDLIPQLQKIIQSFHQ